MPFQRIVRVFWFAAPLVAVLAFVFSSGKSTGQNSNSKAAPATVTFAKIKATLNSKCYKCHTGAKAEAEIDLSGFQSENLAVKDLPTWKKILDVLETGQMPPKEGKPLSALDREEMVGWIKGKIRETAKKLVPDPGPVSFRRLSHVEYNNSVRDLTGVDLQPGREFPKDGAAGEGFTNAMEALSMSPALFDKYLNAARKIASHAVLTPDGFRFSQFNTRRDWTDELVDEIRSFYDQFADANGTLPLEAYLRAAMELHKGNSKERLESISRERKLNAKCLRAIYQTLSDSNLSLFFQPLREVFAGGNPGDISRLVGEIQALQKVMWKTNSVGHFKKWHEADTQITSKGGIMTGLGSPPESGFYEITFQARSQTGASPQGEVVWRNPRFSTGGRATVLLKDLPRLGEGFEKTSQAAFAKTTKYLEAVGNCFYDKTLKPDQVAATMGLEKKILLGWMDLVGFASTQPFAVENHLKPAFQSTGGYDFVKGWGIAATPNIIANSSDRTVQVPGTIPGKSVCVHPSVGGDVIVGWRSPTDFTARVQPRVEDAHAACGNGVTWSLEIRQGNRKRVLASGVIDNGGKPNLPPIPAVQLAKDDLLALVIGSRDRNHICDLTLVDLEIADTQPGGKTWKLSQDVASNIHEGNPHADAHGNKAIWHFFLEGQVVSPITDKIPPGSMLALWREQLLKKAGQPVLQPLVEKMQNLLQGAAPKGDHPDAKLSRLLHSLDGPLFRDLEIDYFLARGNSQQSAWGLPPDFFGSKKPGDNLQTNDLHSPPGGILKFKIPAFLAEGRALDVEATLAPGVKNLFQIQVNLGQGKTSKSISSLLSSPDSKGRKLHTQDLDRFRKVFPLALCYRRIVPVDEVITMVLHHREDDSLKELMLNEGQSARLDRLWHELEFVSQDPLRIQDAYPQFMEYASQENLTTRFTQFREPIWKKADQFRKEMVGAESKQWAELESFASRAFRRPLQAEEKTGFKKLYTTLRSQKMEHEEAFQLILAAVFSSPAFLYKLESPGPGKDFARVSENELAARLSYFLWSSTPDEALTRLAEKNELTKPGELKKQVARLLADPRSRALAAEFACQWLDFRGFDVNDEKNEKLFPEFASLRGAMYEEALQYFMHLFRENRPVLEIIHSDYLFLNEDLARHYGIAGVKGKEWRRVEGAAQHGRGGILGMAAPLAAQSGASRTSPILRGNWVSESLLGEKLPKPPPNVPQLPEKENSSAFSVRQLVEQHSSNPKCAVCHARIDPLGFSLERYDAIGRLREKDGGGAPGFHPSGLKRWREI